MKKSSESASALLVIRSAVFSTFMLVTTIFYSFICILSYPFPIGVRYKVVTAWTRSNVWALKVICGINYRLEGMENLNKSNGIVLCKHQSTWETIFLPGLLHQAAIIVKRELLWLPFFGWGLAALSPIGIDRKSGSTAMQQILKQGTKYLQAGRWVLVFPEGTRIPYGQTGKYRIGGARLAAETGYPVIPIAHNAGKFWPRRKFIKYPGTIHVVIGPAIESTGRTADEILALAKQWIETTCTKLG